MQEDEQKKPDNTPRCGVFSMIHKKGFGYKNIVKNKVS